MIFAALLFAVINCVEQGDGSWICSGGSELPEQIIVDKDGNLTCTNCVNMTPAECEEVKVTIKAYITAIQTKLNTILSNVAEAKDDGVSQIQKFQSFPDPDPPADFGTASSSVPYQAEYIAYIHGLYLDYPDYRLNFTPPVYDSSLPSSTAVSQFRQSCNAIIKSFVGGTFQALNAPDALQSILYAYYHGVYLVVQDWVSQLQYQQPFLESIEENANLIQADTVDMLSAVNTHIKCDTCVLSSASGSGGGGSSGGGSSVTNSICPECLKEILNQISAKVTLIDEKLVAQKAVLDSHLQITTQAKEFLEELVAKFKDFSDNFETYSGNLTNLVIRIDDYLEEDQKINLECIRQAVIVLSNDVDTVQKKFFTRAVKALALEGQTPGIEPQYLANDATPFATATNIMSDLSSNQSLYRSYDWFSRVEMILLSIAAPSQEKVESAISSTVESQIVSKVEQLQEALDGSSVNSKFSSLGSQVKATYQKVANLIPPSAPAGTVILLDSGSWIGESELTLVIPAKLQTCCHTLMVALWTALALTIFVYYAMFFIPVIWKILLDIINVIGAIAGQNVT